MRKAIPADAPTVSPGLRGAPRLAAHGASASLRFELQRRRVDAVAQARRLRAVVEDVAEMAATITALHLGTPHAEAAVGFGFDSLLLGRRPKTGPAGSGVKLLI